MPNGCAITVNIGPEPSTINPTPIAPGTGPPPLSLHPSTSLLDSYPSPYPALTCALYVRNYAKNTLREKADLEQLMDERDREVARTEAMEMTRLEDVTYEEAYKIIRAEQRAELDDFFADNGLEATL